jgi:hypothetical protein
MLYTPNHIRADFLGDPAQEVRRDFYGRGRTFNSGSRHNQAPRALFQTRMALPKTIKANPANAKAIKIIATTKKTPSTHSADVYCLSDKDERLLVLSDNNLGVCLGFSSLAFIVGFAFFCESEHNRNT